MIWSTMLAIFDSRPPSSRKEGRHQGQIHWSVCIKVTLTGTSFSFSSLIPADRDSRPNRRLLFTYPTNSAGTILCGKGPLGCQKERRHLFFWEDFASPEGPGVRGQMSGGCFRGGKPQLPSVLGSTGWPRVPGESPGLLLFAILYVLIASGH